MSKRRRESGFSLFEVTIALAIIAFAIFAIMSMIMGTMASQESLREQQVAKEAVAQKIEEIKANPFTQVQGKYPTGTTFLVPALRNPAVPNAPAQGTITTQIDATSTLIDVLVSVSWKSRKGNSTYSMRSLYAK